MAAHSRGKHFFVCSKHFGVPYNKYPDFTSALAHQQNEIPETVRPRPRPYLPFVEKERSYLKHEGPLSLDMLALAVENYQLKEDRRTERRISYVPSSATPLLLKY